MTKPATASPEKPAAAPASVIPAKLPKQFIEAELEFELVQAHAEGDDAGKDEEPKIVLTLSTEREFKTGYGTFVMEHSEAAIDMSLAKHGLSLLVEHGGSFDPYSGTAGRIDPMFHIGSVENIRLEGKKLKGDPVFSDSAFAQQIKRDLISRARRFGSVGWVPMLYQETKLKNGDVRVRWTRWAPKEYSIVSVPKDPDSRVSVKSDGSIEFPVAIEGATPAQEEKDPMKNKLNPLMDGEPAGGGTRTAHSDPPATPEAPKPTATVQVDEKAFAKRASEIVTLCHANGAPELAPKFIEENLSVEGVKARLLDRLSHASGSDRLKAPPSPQQIAGEVARGARGRKYSVRRALRASLDLVEGRKAHGYEFEIHQAIASIHKPQKGGILIPISASDLGDPEEREAHAMGTGVAGGGAELVFDQPGALIDIFRAKSPLGRLGVRFLPGLTNPIPFPRVTADPTVYHVGENPAAGVTRSQTTFDTVQLSPRTLMGEVVLPKQLLLLSSVDMEADTQNRLGIQHGLAIARGAIKGSGGQNEPLGLLNVPGVQTHAFGGVPDVTKLTKMAGKVADQDAAFGALGWLSTVGLATTMKHTLEHSASGSKVIWTGTWEEGEVIGYKATSVTGSIMPTDLGGGSEHALAFGKWDEATVGLFGVLEALPNPYLLASYGQVVIHTYQMYDALIQRPIAFVLATGATIS